MFIINEISLYSLLTQYNIPPQPWGHIIRANDKRKVFTASAKHRAV